MSGQKEKSKKWGFNRIKNLFGGKQPKNSAKVDSNNNESTEDRRIFTEDLRTKDNMNDRFHDLPRIQSSTKTKIMSIKDRQLKIESNLDKVRQNINVSGEDIARE